MKRFWNYRLVKREYETEGFTAETMYEIHEAHYGPDGKLESITEDGVDPHGATPEEVRSDLHRMLAAFEKPVVDYDTLKELPEQPV